MRAYGVRGAHWEAKIVFFKIKWFFGMTRCHACLRNSVLYPKMRLGRHMYQCWVLAAKPRFRWHAAHFSDCGCRYLEVLVVDLQMLLHLWYL